MNPRLLILAAIFAAYAAAAPPSGIEQEGKAFRERIWNSYRQKEAANAQRITDMTSDCQAASLAGRPIGDVQRLLNAAGQHSAMIRHTGPTAQPNELVGGFTLASSFGYTAVFNIVVRTQGDKVDAIVLCNVLMRSF